MRQVQSVVRGQAGPAVLEQGPHGQPGMRRLTAWCLIASLNPGTEFLNLWETWGKEMVRSADHISRKSVETVDRVRGYIKEMD